MEAEWALGWVSQKTGKSWYVAHISYQAQRPLCDTSLSLQVPQNCKGWEGKAQDKSQPLYLSPPLATRGPCCPRAGPAW